MDNRRKPLLFALLPVIFCLGASGAPVLDLIPANGTIGGAPGDVVGWGFTLTNTTDFLVVTSADFVSSPALGTFTDFIGPNFIVVGPTPESPMVSQLFDALSMTGIGSFAISPSAGPGSTANGQIQLTYDLFSRSPNDPNFNPATDTLSVGNLLSRNASAEVVPEPASWFIIVAAGVALAVWRGHRQQYDGRYDGARVRGSRRERTSRTA